MSAFPYSNLTPPAVPQNPYGSGSTSAFSTGQTPFFQDVVRQMYNYNSGAAPWGGMGFGYINPQTGPTNQQVMGGLMFDWASQAGAQQQTFDQNRQAADMFLNQSQAAAQKMLDPVNTQVQQALEFQKQGAEQAARDYATMQQQMAAAQAKAEASKAEVGGIYDQAFQQIGGGVDKVASSMAAAVERRKQADVDAFLSQNMGAFPGTESQIQEAARRKGSEYDQMLFGQVSELQYGAERDKAAVLQNKANTFASLGQSLAQMGMQAAELGYQGARDKNQWNQFGAQLSMANAQLHADVAQNYAQLTQAGLANYAKLVYSNPVMGLTLTPTLLQMQQVARSSQPQFGEGFTPIT